jgi:hypothetical protein
MSGKNASSSPVAQQELTLKEKYKSLRENKVSSELQK